MKYYYDYKSPVGELTIIGNEEHLLEVTFKKDTPYQKKITPVIKETIKQLDEYFNGTRKTFNIPYQITGTPFRLLVWSKLTSIPYGKTINYQELACMVDNPKASRAVGNANKANPLLIIIPCHRVIKKDNTIGGYAGTKSNLKERLLRGEGYDLT